MKRIGVLGAGQLGRMLALAGYPLGMQFRFLDPGFDAPAGQIAELVAGRFNEPAALERFAVGVDLATYEFESVPVPAVESLLRVVPVFPPVEALAIAQDRLFEKQLFAELGIATAPYHNVETRHDLDAAIEQIGCPAILKTRRLGYDGKGQYLIEDTADCDAAWAQLRSNAMILEGVVPFRGEYSLISARAQNGEVVHYPLVANEHRLGILRVSRMAPRTPAMEALEQQAIAASNRLLERLQYVGVLAVEYFDAGIHIVANEMAPRVHNSGHWTIEGAVTSQFANHLRAICGMPLGSTAARGPSAMVNLIGGVPDADEILRIAGASLHLYGKEPRAGRKLGHVTVVAPDEASLKRSLERVCALAFASSQG